MIFLQFGCWIWKDSWPCLRYNNCLVYKYLAIILSSAHFLFARRVSPYPHRSVFHHRRQRIHMQMSRAHSHCLSASIILVTSTHNVEWYSKLNSSNKKCTTGLLSWVSLLQDLEITSKQKARVTENTDLFCFSYLIVLCGHLFCLIF